MRVGRRYFFRGLHSVPALPVPWCTPHTHDYTVEVVFEVTALNADGLSVNHEDLDRRWTRWLEREALLATWPPPPTYAEGMTIPTPDFYIDLDKMFDHTTVEALANEFRVILGGAECSVWEDNDRWASTP